MSQLTVRWLSSGVKGLPPGLNGARESEANAVYVVPPKNSPMNGELAQRGQMWAQIAYLELRRKALDHNHPHMSVEIRALVKKLVVKGWTYPARCHKRFSALDIYPGPIV